MAHDYLFTVFTPTFNRAALLSRVYESLTAQTFRDFEWLIVDDGSSDGTRALVETWQAAANFPIRYLWQANAGKHVAFNRAAQAARGELLLTLDSDDACLPGALERFAHHWAVIQSLPAEQASGFSGVTALCQDQHGNPIGSRFPRDVVDSDSNEMKFRFHSKGERWGFHRVEVFREFPFPELANHTFVPESIVWFAMGRKYKTRYVNEVLRTYWLDDGSRITTQAVGSPNAAGQALFRRTVLNTNLRYFRYSPVELTKTAIQYTRYSLHAGDGLWRQGCQLSLAAARLLWLGTAPVGWLLFSRDRRAAAKSKFDRHDVSPDGLADRSVGAR